MRRDIPMKVNKKKYTSLIELWLGQEKGSKKTRKKIKALATLHAALMHYIHYLKKTVTKIRHLLGQWFPTSPEQPL